MQQGGDVTDCLLIRKHFVVIPHLLRTRLFPLQAQGNEELVRLQTDADTGNLRLLDMLLDLDLFLSFAIDRWTACVTH